MLCGRCNHDNPELNNYCGMCGFRLEKPSAKPAEPVPAAKEEQPVRVPAASAGAASAGTSILGLGSAPSRPAASRPSITGPSFLGLNTDPGPDHADYLLEDDEPRGHAGLWIALVLLLVVALAGWRFGAEAAPMARQLYAAVVARVNPQPPAPAAAAAPPTQPASPEAAAASQPPASAAGNDASAPAGGASPDAAPQAAASPSPAKPDNAALTAKEEPAEPAKPSPASKPVSKEDAAPSTSTPKAAKLAPATRRVPAEPVAPEKTAILILAQKYLHGQGVRQDCVTGLAYLREAMRRPNAPAASQMGALYATGTCMPLDRLAAYRYFTSAMQLAPDDPWLGQERDKLYGQMTSAERRQADQQ